MISAAQPRYFRRIGAVLVLACALVDALSDTAPCLPPSDVGVYLHGDAGVWLAAQPAGACVGG